jgi:hypothetical protein
VKDLAIFFVWCPKESGVTICPMCIGVNYLFSYPQSPKQFDMLRVISQLYLCAKAFSKSIEEADPGQGRPRRFYLATNMGPHHTIDT